MAKYMVCVCIIMLSLIQGMVYAAAEDSDEEPWAMVGSNGKVRGREVFCPDHRMEKCIDDCATLLTDMLNHREYEEPGRGCCSSRRNGAARKYVVWWQIKEQVQSSVCEHGIDIRSIMEEKGVLGSNEKCALWCAVDQSLPSVVELLLCKKVDHDICTKDKKNLLMIAALRGNIGIAQLLLNAGICLNATDKDGCTALWYAMAGCPFLLPETDSKKNLMLFERQAAMVRFLMSLSIKDPYPCLHNGALSEDIRSVLQECLIMHIDGCVLL